MSYPITYAYPAKTFPLIALSYGCATLGLFGTLINLGRFFQSEAEVLIGPFAMSLLMLFFFSGVIRRMANPHKISLTETELQLPKTVLGGAARSVPYEDIKGVSLHLHRFHRTAVIFTKGRNFSFSTHVVGYEAFFELIEKIHQHADLGPAPIGTLRGAYRAGRDQW